MHFPHLLGAFALVVVAHALDLGLHDQAAHFSVIPFGLGDLVFRGSHDVDDSVSDVLLFLVLQICHVCTHGPVGLFHHGPGLAGEKADLVLQALLAGLVVPLAVGCVHGCLGVVQGGLETGEGLGHGVHSPGIALHAILDDVHGVLAGNGAIGDHIVDRALVHAVVLTQHADHVYAALLEHVEIFQRGLAAGLHTAEHLGHNGHAAGIHTQGAAGVADALHQVQHALQAADGAIGKAGGQRPAHGRQVAVFQGRRGCEGLHSIQIPAAVAVAQQLIEGDPVQLPLGGCSRAAADPLLQGGQLAFHFFLYVIFEILVLGLVVLGRASHQAHQSADPSADSRADAGGDHGTDGSTGARAAQSAGQEIAAGAAQIAAAQGQGPLACHVADLGIESGLADGLEHVHGALGLGAAAYAVVGSGDSPGGLLHVPGSGPDLAAHQLILLADVGEVLLCLPPVCLGGFPLSFRGAVAKGLKGLLGALGLPGRTGQVHFHLDPGAVEAVQLPLQLRHVGPERGHRIAHSDHSLGKIVLDAHGYAGIWHLSRLLSLSQVVDQQGHGEGLLGGALPEIFPR